MHPDMDRIPVIKRKPINMIDIFLFILCTSTFMDYLFLKGNSSILGRFFYAELLKNERNERF